MRTKHRCLPRLGSAAAVCAALVVSSCAHAPDWPMWRYDANRSANSPHALAPRLHLQWVRQYTPRTMCWGDRINRERMPFDRAFLPVVMGRTMFVAFNDTDKLVALDTRTGEERWRFYADGPIRFAPVCDRGRVCFASDDGYLYGLDAATGRLLWRRRGGPSVRRILGNRRLISSWPARGGPVLQDGVIYWAAGIWPFMGIFVRATDVRTGTDVWINDGLGPKYTLQPHASPGFGGIAPQGAIACHGDRLVIPCGRSVPACLDRRTGKLLYYYLGENSRRGGSQVSTNAGVFINNNVVYNLATGTYQTYADTHGVLTDGIFYGRGGAIRALDPRRLDKITVTLTNRDRTTVTYVRKRVEGKETMVRKVAVDRVVKEKRVRPVEGQEPQIRYRDYLWKGRRYFEPLEPGETPSDKPVVTFSEPTLEDRSHRAFRLLWTCKVRGNWALIKAGDRLYCGDDDSVSAVRRSGGKASVAWTQPVTGRVVNLLAADERLFAVTLQGRIYCFGPRRTAPKTFPREPDQSSPRSSVPRAGQVGAGRVLELTGARAGYCLVVGAEGGDRIESLVRQSELHVVALESDPAKVAKLRRRFDAAGLYGRRVSLLVGDLQSASLPPYFASSAVVTDPAVARSADDGRFLKKLFRSLRPYGGTALLAIPDKRQAAFAQAVAKCGLAHATLRGAGGVALLTRSGALPGAGTWTHHYADAANTVVSRDDLVKPPFGLLWFGGSTHDKLLPQHGHGPSQHVVGGRLFIEGPNILRALDVYTGRVLWERDLPGVGKAYDHRNHYPGAGMTGGNYVSLPDGVYIAHGSKCLRLDPATGATVREFTLPLLPGETKPPRWAYINAWGDYLIGGSGGIILEPVRTRDGIRTVNLTLSHSKRLTVMNRHTGRVLWSRTAGYGFRHNAIAAGDAKLFCLDRFTRLAVLSLSRSDQLPDAPPSLSALDLKTGRVAWQDTKRVFGTWLGYSAEHDALLQAGRPSRDMPGDENGRRMTTFRGTTGDVIWDRPELRYSGPPLLRGRTIYAQGAGYDLLTGKRLMRTHPVTGKPTPWRLHRTWGCGSIIGSTHLLTLRSAAAAYYDLDHDGGTANLGGFRSGCASNLIVADGVLSAPDYTRACTCSYQNQTSLAMVHWPEGETWTYLRFGSDPMAANLGAPGGRRAADGTAWGAWPVPTLPSRKGRLPRKRDPDPPVVVEFDPRFGYWCDHSSRYRAAGDGGGLPWVASSGVRGVKVVTLRLATAERRTYTLRLHFAEPDDIAPGMRVFDVSVGGRTVLRDFDIVKAAGGPRRAVVRTVAGISVSGRMTVTFTPKGKGPLPETRVPVLSGVEVRRSAGSRPLAAR